MTIESKPPSPGQVAELAVLTAVLAIAAIASYIHLRGVWLHAGAPVPTLGPLLVDGLFAAAWLRMRRRRGMGERVGVLAWLALGLALVATVAGNLAAAVIAGHRDPLSLVVAAWPAIAFALVWELVTGHGRAASPAVASERVNLENFPWGESPLGTYEPAEPPADTTAAAPAVALHLAPSPAGAGDREEAGGEAGDRAAQLIAAGAGRRKLAAELGISEHEARKLAARRDGTSP